MMLTGSPQVPVRVPGEKLCDFLMCQMPLTGPVLFPHKIRHPPLLSLSASPVRRLSAGGPATVRSLSLRARPLLCLLSWTSDCEETPGRITMMLTGSPQVSLRVPGVKIVRFLDVSNALEVDNGFNFEVKEDSASEHQQKTGQLKKRIFFGLGIGIFCGGVVLAGGLVFTCAIAAAAFVGAREYFELVRSRGIAEGMTPPPRYLSRVCSFICVLMPIVTLYFGHIDVSLTSAAFFVAMALLLQRGNPRFAQLSSTMFGLFYCGYLPCFWVKLRCRLAVPALNTRVEKTWPLLLGGQTQWTVGLVATLISFSSIIAADTCAFVGGKAFGQTQLITISPKKTWEGAAAGLGGCIATSVLLSRILSWPPSFLCAIGFGILNFFGSLFGDLTESMIKRDAGVKDSGSLIPGHGGILDRTDSYIFTGALAFSFVKTLLPLYGVGH